MAVSTTSCSGQICQLPCSRDSLMAAETSQLLWLQILLCIHTSTIFFLWIFFYMRTVFASSCGNPMQYYKKSHYLSDGFQKCLLLLFQRWLPSLPSLLYWSDDFSFSPSSAVDWKGYPRVGYILTRKVKFPHLKCQSCHRVNDYMTIVFVTHLNIFWLKQPMVLQLNMTCKV